jgi:membrane-associated protease RseP (regulator of RpoE activity)
VASGLNFSITFLSILTIHEFGHYYFAKKYKLDVSLPYYIPFYLPGSPSIGTFGAFIRMKGQIQSRTSIFDIGIAGPLAGFVAAMALLHFPKRNTFTACIPIINNLVMAMKSMCIHIPT